jgi:GDP-L-fucose synthase
LHLLEVEDPPDWVNLGSGNEISIRELAELVRHAVGFSGAIKFDPSMPDGMPRKLLDHSRMAQLGWSARVDLKQGLDRAYQDFLATLADRTVRC